MDFYAVDEKRLLALMNGLHLIETLNAEGAANLDLFLYGMTSDPGVLSAAKETLIDNMEDYWDEEGRPTIGVSEISLSEVALAIDLSSDTIYALTGRHGIDLARLDFAYDSGGGEGIREEYFMGQQYRRGLVTFGILKHPAIASGSHHLREYTMKHRSGQPMSVNKKVQRQEPAISPSPAPVPPTGTTPVTGSLREMANLHEDIISSTLEGFLDLGRG